jgi:hypothetical protein
LVTKLEIVLNASVGSMLPMPSGLSGRNAWSMTIGSVASHITMFDTSNETEYCFQSCWSFESTPVRLSTNRSMGTRSGSRNVRFPVNTFAM